MNKDAFEYANKAQELRNKGNFSKAKKLIKKVISLVDKDNYFMLGQVYAFCGQLERDLKNLERALTWYSMAMKTYENGKFQSKTIHALRHIAEIETEIGNTKKAQDAYIRTLKFYTTNENTAIGELANTQRGYAVLLEKTEDFAAAKKHWIKARDLYKKLDLTEGVDECLHHISKL